MADAPTPPCRLLAAAPESPPSCQHTPQTWGARPAELSAAGQASVAPCCLTSCLLLDFFRTHLDNCLTSCLLLAPGHRDRHAANAPSGQQPTPSVMWHTAIPPTHRAVFPIRKDVALPGMSGQPAPFPVGTLVPDPQLLGLLSTKP